MRVPVDVWRVGVIWRLGHETAALGVGDNEKDIVLTIMIETRTRYSCIL
jgi:hypothetical protein